MQIGELSRLTGISTRMLRHYDAIGLLQPASRAANGYREYDAADITRLMHVEGLKTLGLSLDAIRSTLDGAEHTPADLIDDLIESTRSRIARERQLITRLEAVRDSNATTWDDALAVIALMQALDSPDPSRRLRVALSGSDAVPANALVDALLTESDLNVAGAMSWAVTRSAGEAMSQLTAALDAADDATRFRAITAIARLDAKDVLPVLKTTLHHVDQRVREVAALALGTRGEIDAAAELLDMVVRGSHDVDAADALGQIASVNAEGSHVSELIGVRLAAAHETPGARGRLTQALGEIPGSQARDILAGLVDDADKAVSLTARYLLSVRADE